MTNKQRARAEKTRKAILTAAEALFSTRSFDAVTMRDIAELAGCSHTTIYIYFDGKEALLNELAAEPLRTALRRLERTLYRGNLSPDERLAAFSREFLRLALSQRALYPVFFTVRASRVDEKDPALELQRLRNEIFALAGRALQAALGVHLAEDRLLAYTRSYFYLLHGIVASYAASPESLDELLARLGPTFDLACLCMFRGIRAHVHEGRQEVSPQ